MERVVFQRWSFRNIPRGMTRLEAFIFEDFLLRKNLFGELMAFQVPLHGGRLQDGVYPPNILKQWDKLSSYKADVIMKIGSTYTIYEIKDILDSGTLGQLLTYRSLFENVLGFPSGTFLGAVAVDSGLGAIQPLVDFGIRVHLRSFNWGTPPNFSSAFIRSQAVRANTA